MPIELHAALIQAAATITAAKIANRPGSSGTGLQPPDVKSLFKQTYSELEQALNELDLESPPPQIV